MRAPVYIYIVLPFAGLLGWVALVRRIWARTGARALASSYFVLFVHLGGWLQVLLTALYCEWSGMASIGAIYLALLSPFVAAAVAGLLWRRRSDSGYSRWAFRPYASYVVLVGLLGPVWFLVGALGVDIHLRSP